MDGQNWVEVAGKVGPASVAAAVFIATLAQNRWANRVARRNAEVEDQKLRLSLLERRIATIDDYDKLHDEWVVAGEITGATIGRLQEVIIAAELVFPGNIEQLEACRDNLFRMYQADRRLAANVIDDDVRNKLIEDAVASAEALGTSLVTLRRALIEATKVASVPPLPLSFLDRVFGPKA